MLTPDVDEAEEFRLALLAALSDLMAPLVQVCLEAGVSAADVERTVRHAFVVAAKENFKGDKDLVGAVTDEARISAVTGVALPDVKELLTERIDVDSIGSQSALISILSAWEKQPEYLGAYGVPLDLPINPTDDGLSFASLVQKHGLGLSVEDALAKLESQKRIQRIEEDTVRHVWNFVVFRASATDFPHHMRRAFVRLGKTISHNFAVGDDGQKRLEQVQYSDVPITEEQYFDFDQRVREKIEELFKWSDSWLGSVGKENDARSAMGEDLDPREIWPGIGVYQFNDSPEEAPGNSENRQENK